MAMTKCRECGNRISTLAAACPSCGAPTQKTAEEVKKEELTGAGCGCLFLLVVVGVVAYRMGAGSSTPPITPEPETKQGTKSSKGDSAAAAPAVKKKAAPPKKPVAVGNAAIPTPPEEKVAAASEPPKPEPPQAELQSPEPPKEEVKPEAAPAPSDTAEELEPIIDILEIAGSTPTEVAKAIGQPNPRKRIMVNWKFKKQPLNVYKDDSVEIMFVDGKAEYIGVRIEEPDRDLTPDEVLQLIGLEAGEPLHSGSKEQQLMVWRDIEGLSLVRLVRRIGEDGSVVEKKVIVVATSSGEPWIDLEWIKPR